MMFNVEALPGLGVTVRTVTTGHNASCNFEIWVCEGDCTETAASRSWSENPLGWTRVYAGHVVTGTHTYTLTEPVVIESGARRGFYLFAHSSSGTR